MEIAGMLEFEDPNFYPGDLYVDGTHLVIVGASHREMLVSYDLVIYTPGVVSRMGMPSQLWWGYASTTRVLVYDITDKANIRQVRELELEGFLVSSRKIDPVLYLVANKEVYVYDVESPDLGEIRPSYRDSATGGEWVPIDYSDIRYFPSSVDANYLLIAGLDLEHPHQAAQISTYLGAGQNIYMSRRNLYVAASRHRDYLMRPMEIVEVPAVSFEETDLERTEVFKFSLDNGQADYAGKGQVPGAILSQFSMDEFKDHFRIATTTGDVWRVDENTSKNHVYVLNANMALVGRLEDLAPGERIYSARFMGDRLYMVTFRQVDPFFVIDMKNPAHPAVLGALKIPGYSDYLHPYDENHIIGFGRDTTAASGLKIALFDVTNVYDPVELFREAIGDWGTYSELLYNHKALLFCREKNLMAFPVNGYGTFTFQGAYVYEFELDESSQLKGLRMKGRITHLPDIEPADYWNHSARFIQRILYIGDTLYTLSQAEIMANDLTDSSPSRDPWRSRPKRKRPFHSRFHEVVGQLTTDN